MTVNSIRFQIGVYDADDLTGLLQSLLLFISADKNNYNYYNTKRGLIFYG